MKNLFCLVLLLISTILIGQNTVEVDTTQANLLFVQSQDLYKNGDYKEAEDLAKKAIKAYQKELGDKENALAYAWYHLGQCQSDRGDFLASIQSYENVMKTKEENYPVREIVKNYGDMAYSYKSLKDGKNETKILDTAIQLASDSLGEEDATLVVLYVYKAYGLTDFEEFTQAFTYLQKASEIAEKKMKNEPEKLAKVESAMAKYHYKKGDFQKAAERIERVAESFEKNGNLNSPSLASTYNNMAACYQELRNFDKALLYFNKSIAIYKKIGNESSIPVAQSNQRIGNCMTKAGRYEDAIPYLEKAMEVMIKVLPPNHPIIARTEDSMARCFLGSKEFDKAILLFKEARKKFANDLGEDVLDVFKMDLQIGNCYTEQKKYLKAQEHYNRAYTIIEKLDFRPGFTGLNIAFANLYSAQNKIEKADEYYEKALQTFDYDKETGFIKSSRYEQYLDALETAAQLKLQAYEHTKDQRYLEETLDLTRRARKFIIHLKSIARTSIPTLVQSYRWIYEGNIKALGYQQDLQLNTDGTAEVFQVMEEAKDNLILLALQEMKADSYKGLSNT